MRRKQKSRQLMEDSPGDVDELRTGLERKRKEGTERRKEGGGRR